MLDADLRWLLLANLARLGPVGEAEIAAEQERDPSVTGAEQAAGSRAAQPTAAAKAEAWRLAVETDEITNTVHQAICLSFWQRGQDEVLLPYVDRYFAAAEDISAARGLGRQGVAAQERAPLALPWPLDKQASWTGWTRGWRRADCRTQPAGSSTSDATTWCGRCAASGSAG